MDTIKNWLSGNTGPDDKVQLMRRKAKVLRARAADINSEVDHEELHPGKKRKREVEHWLKEVHEVDIQVQSLEQQLENSRKLESGSVSRAGYLSNEIGDLLDKGCFPRGLTFYDHGSSSVALVTPDIKINNHKFEDIKRKIMSCLSEDSPISSIGVFGPGGVGKTTLLKEIHNELLEQLTSSRNIYWVSVSHGTTPLMLTDKIAEAMGLLYVLDEKNETRRASKLHYEIQRRKTDLLILDDVWEHFSLEQVGIPAGVDYCKLIIATRSLDVCKRMNCGEIVKVEPLCQEEAWKLLCKGLKREIPSEIERIAQLVAAECAGLPLGIIIMSGSMRGIDDIEEWQNTLEELRNSTVGQSDMDKDVFPVLRLSYDRLKDPNLQQCFLLCSLYPKDCEIQRDELIMLFRSEGLLDGIDSWEKQNDRAHSMLNKLENMCLLEKCSFACVKMHNLIREMAIRITNSEPRYMIAAGAKLRRVPSVKRWSLDLVKVSLMHNFLSEIQPGRVPMCPSLSTLLLQRNPFTKLPDSFFENMKGLKVVNLSNTRMKRLPSSISDLDNLRALLLENCSNLVFVPSLVKLTKLRELSLRFCWSLNDVPHGMSQLASIRFLDLEGSKNLCRHLCGSLSTLSDIQCLKLDPDVTSILGGEIVNFGDLERLEGCRIAEVGDFNSYTETQHFQQLGYFEFVVGTGEFKRIDYNYPISEKQRSSCKRIVVVCSHKLGGGNKEELFIPPDNTQYLQIHNCDFSVKSLVGALPSLYNLTALRKILIRRCRMLEFTWSTQSCFEAASLMSVQVPKIIPPFHSLKELILTDLQDFKGLVNEEAALPQGAFSSLEILVIKFCPKVKKLFTSNLFKRFLDNLQQLEIEGCGELEEIIATSDSDEDDYQQGITESEGNVNRSNCVIRLPNLMALKLRCLPKLTNICHKALLGDGSMVHIIVEYCGEIKNIFMTSVPSHLRNLREVKVVGCQNLLEIIAMVHSSDCEESSIIELPNLRTLEMNDLPLLTSFFPGKLLKCRSIEHVIIQDCPYLRKPPLPGYEITSVPPCFQDIRADRDWLEYPDSHNLLLKQLLQPFTKLSDANISSFGTFKELDSSRFLGRLESKASMIGASGIDFRSCCTEISYGDGAWNTDAIYSHDEYKYKQVEEPVLANIPMKEVYCMASKEQPRNMIGLEARHQPAKHGGESSDLNTEVEQFQQASTDQQPSTGYDEIEKLRASYDKLTEEHERMKLEMLEKVNKVGEEIQQLRSQLTQMKQLGLGD